MFYVRDEGEKRENGFNFYPLNSKSSIGFVLKIGRNGYFFRWSKKSKTFHIKRVQISIKEDVDIFKS